MANINIEIKLMTDRLQRAARDAQESLKDIQKTAKATNDSISKGAKQSTTAWEVFKGALSAQVVVGAFNSVGRAALDLGKTVVGATAQIEDITAQFTSLTGSVENAEELLKDLSEFAASTPFQLPGLSRASKTLLAFGFEQEEIIKRLQVLGDVASVTGRDVSDIALIFGQVAAAGKLTGERLNQLQESGIPVLKTLAEQLGITQGEVRNLVTKGKIDFKTFERAFNSLNKEGGIAFQGLQKRSETLSGVFSTLQDNIFLLSAEIGEELSPILKNIAVTFTDFIQQNRDLAREISKNTVAFLVRGFEALSEVVPNISSAFESLKTNFLIFTSDSIGGFADILEVVNVFAQSVSSAFLEVEGVIRSFASDILSRAIDITKGIENIFGIDVGTADFAQDLIDGLNDVNDAATDLAGPLDDTIVSVREWEKVAQEAANSKLAESLDVVGESSEEAAKSVDSLKKELQELPTNLATDVNVSAEQVSAEAGISARELLTSEELAAIKETEKARRNSEKDLKRLQVRLERDRIRQLSQVGNVLGAGSGQDAAQTLISELGTTAADALLPGLGAVAGPLLDVFSQGEDATRSFVEDFAESLPELIKGIAEAAPVFIEAIVENLPGLISALAKASPAIARALLLGVPAALLEGLRKGIETTIVPETKKAGKTFADLIDGAGVRIGDATEKLGEALGDAAVALLGAGDALIEGISTGLEGIFNGLSIIVDGLISDEFLNKIAKVFEDAGTNFVRAIEDVFSGIERTIRDFVDQIGDALSFDLPGSSGGGGGVLDQIGGAISDVFGGIPGFATGGMVTGSGTRDTVPALLTPGEIVIDRTTGPRLNRFLNAAENGGVGNQQVVALLSQVVESLNNPQQANVQLNLDNRVLADEILELTRNNARLG